MSRRVRFSRSRNKPVSEVVREAIAAGLPVSFYDSIADLVGVVRSGDPTGSESMGRKLTELLKKRRRKSRS